MSKGLIATLGIVGFIVILGLWFGFSWGPGIYDKAVSAQEKVNNEFADVQAAAENEHKILTEVTQARAGIVNAKTPEDLEIMGRKINTAINLAFEAYPQIRSTENFQELQSQLEGTENRINVARQRYNAAIAEYNTFVRGFWKKKALSLFGGDEDFSIRKGFEASAEAQDAPKVDFNKK